MSPREVSNAEFEGYKGGVANIRTLPDGEEGIDLRDSGIDTSMHPEQIAQNKSPNAQNVRLTDQGLSSEPSDVILGTAYAGAGDKTIMRIAEFQRKSGGISVLYRIRPSGADMWNGAAWTTLPGSLAGSSTLRPHLAIASDRFLIANGSDRIKMHDGQAATALADLSADAPRARLIAPFGRRVVAAYIKPDIGDVDPYFIKWSADGNIFEWTSALLGAGSGVFEPEGGYRNYADFITALSALETVLVIYRQSSIAVATRTGLGSAPFRFYTVVVGTGTLSPHSVTSIGTRVGDLFLGQDLNVYLFRGQGAPEPIGDPIHRTLRATIKDPFNVVGAYDHRKMDFWLGIPTSDGGLIQEAWVLSVRELLLNRKIIWHKRALPAGTKTIGMGFKVANTDPIVNTVLTIVNQTSCVVNFCGNVVNDRYVMFGNNIGEVRALDFTAFIGGFWYSKRFGSVDFETTVDRVYGRYTGRVAGSIKVGVTFDGGATVVAERTVNFTAGNNSFSTWHEVTGRGWQLKIEVVSGDLTIVDLKAVTRVRGRLSSAA